MTASEASCIAVGSAVPHSGTCSTFLDYHQLGPGHPVAVYATGVGCLAGRPLTGPGPRAFSRSGQRSRARRGERTRNHRGSSLLEQLERSRPPCWMPASCAFALSSPLSGQRSRPPMLDACYQIPWACDPSKNSAPAVGGAWQLGGKRQLLAVHVWQAGSAGSHAQDSASTSRSLIS